jgi:hypothetical protein
MNRHLAIESEIIAPTVREIHACAPDFDVLVVGDRSSDETASAALRARARPTLV